jgi:hypothetical protein
VVDDPGMRIATDTTAEYTSPTANDSSLAPATDRRRRARLLGKSTGWIFLGDDDHAPAREITVTDVSRLGVGFVCETQMEIGFMCRVRIGFGPKRLARRLKIANCRKNGDGTFTLGGEFA